jgi:uncharacterized protein
MQENEQQEQEREKTRTRQDAGRLGGLKTARKHGPDFYRKIGRAGGKARGVKKEEKETVGNSV